MSCETFIMAAPFRVKALYDYASPHEDDLNFPSGQVITVTDEEDAEWYGGEYTDDAGVKKEGIFPRNFVEKFEPTPPPRPTRTRTKKAEDAPTQQPEPEPEQPAPVPVASQPTPAVAPPVPKDEPEPESEPEVEEPKASEPRSPPARAAVPVPTPVAAPPPKATATNIEQPPKPAPRDTPTTAPAPAPKPKPSGPPPVVDKPTSNSFKDRIAAFNKPAAAPIAPFKPSGLGSSGFIKKPFVPPPPSRDAYVPVPREQVTQKIYRRSEDPEIREQEAQHQEQAEKAGLFPAESKQEAGEGEDDQPKPTSLKERIALLAKQQQEQAQRHADAAAKKEKPKKPAKKKPELPAGEPAEETEDAELAPLERRDTETTIGRTSLEEQAPVQAPPPPRRKASRGPATESPHDGNEADMSGAGDTTEGQDDTSDRDDEDEAPNRSVAEAASTSPTLSRVPTARDDRQKTIEEPQGEEEEEEGEEDEEDVDPEVRRKEELRARMAKMSGGMGFHGIFGAPMPPTGGLPKRSKPEKAPKDDTESRTEDVKRSAPPIPTPMALPGMGGLKKSQEQEAEDEEEDKLASSLPSPPPVPTRAPAVPETDDADAEQEESDDDDATPGPASRSEAPRAPPPVPGGRPAPPPVPSEREYTCPINTVFY